MRKIDEAYEFIKRYITEKDYPPTIREIGEAIGVSSTSTVAYYLRKLEENNKIVKGSYKNRSIQLTETLANHMDKANLISIPLVKPTECVRPLIIERNIKSKYIFSGSMFRGLDMKMVVAPDNTMQKSSILKGDILVVSRQNTARNGEIVVAIINNEYRVLRLYKEYNYYKLVSDSNAVEPVYARGVVLLGKVIGVIRTNV